VLIQHMGVAVQPQLSAAASVAVLTQASATDPDQD
jgi:hypothetical protein